MSTKTLHQACLELEAAFDILSKKLNKLSNTVDQFVEVLDKLGLNLEEE